MIIVLIDTEEQSVTICDKAVRTFSISDADGIRNAINNRQIYYITSAQEASAQELFDLLGFDPVDSGDDSVRQLLSRNDDIKQSKTGRKFLHSTIMGNVIVKHISEDKDKGMVFDNPADFKNIKGSLEEMYSEYPNLEIYIEKGFIEVIDSSDRKIISSKYQSIENSRLAARQAITRNPAEDKDKKLVRKTLASRGLAIASPEDYDDEEEDDETHIDIGGPEARGQKQDILMDDEQKNIFRQIGKVI